MFSNPRSESFLKFHTELNIPRTPTQLAVWRPSSIPALAKLETPCPCVHPSYPLLGAQHDAGHVEDDGQGHLADLAQLLLLVGHADGDGVDEHQGVHALGAVLLAVEHGRAGLAALLVARQQEGAWRGEEETVLFICYTNTMHPHQNNRGTERFWGTLGLGNKHTREWRLTMLLLFFSIVSLMITSITPILLFNAQRHITFLLQFWTAKKTVTYSIHNMKWCLPQIFATHFFYIDLTIYFFRHQKL